MAVSERKLLEILHETGECGDDCPECYELDGHPDWCDAYKEKRDRELEQFDRIPSLLDK